VVKRLKNDILQRTQRQFSTDFNINSAAKVHIHGVGGRTVPKLWKHDLCVVKRVSPHIVMLEIGTNDLVHEDPLVVASSVEVLVRYLHDRFGVHIVGFCFVLPRFANREFNWIRLLYLMRRFRTFLSQFPTVFAGFILGDFRLSFSSAMAFI